MISWNHYFLFIHWTLIQDSLCYMDLILFFSCHHRSGHWSRYIVTWAIYLLTCRNVFTHTSFCLSERIIIRHCARDRECAKHRYEDVTIWYRSFYTRMSFGPLQFVFRDLCLSPDSLVSGSLQLFRALFSLNTRSRTRIVLQRLHRSPRSTRFRI